MRKSDFSNSSVWVTEFIHFVEAKPVEPPRDLSREILLCIGKELNPDPWKVFSKASFIQVVTGFITLLFCPQFGYSLTGAHGIMHLLMKFGDALCMFGCGSLFVGSSLLFSALLLKTEEVAVLRKHRLLQTSLMSLLVVGAFFCLGAEVLETITLAWIGGSILGGIASLELGWITRQWLKAKVIYA